MKEQFQESVQRLSNTERLQLMQAHMEAHRVAEALMIADSFSDEELRLRSFLSIYSFQPARRTPERVWKMAETLSANYPKNSRSLAALGHFYFHHRLWSQASEYFHRTLYGPTDDVLWRQGKFPDMVKMLSRCYLRTGDRNLCLPLIEDYDRNWKDDLQLLFARFEYHSFVGKLDEAGKVLNKIEELYPHCKKIPGLKKELLSKQSANSAPSP